MAEAWLEQLEQLVAEADLATAIVTVASVAGREVRIDPDEARAAARRAVLVLAAGGDPSRGLDLNGPAVERLAEELDGENRRAALEAGLDALRTSATGLPHVREAAQALVDAPDTAWRAFAAALLADQLGAT